MNGTAGWLEFRYWWFVTVYCSGQYAFVACNLLNAVRGAFIDVMLTVGAADRTRGAGGFNLNPAVDCDSTAGFAASYNHNEQLRPVRDAAAGRVGGPSDNV